MKTRKRINGTEIAKRAGVSLSTVSRVINNYPNVPPATRQKVMAVIHELEYYPDFSAQVMAGMRTRTIGLFWVADRSIAVDVLASSFFVRIIEDATKAGYLVLTSMIPSLKEKESNDQIKKIFAQNRIEGAIFFGGFNQEPFIDELVGKGYPVGVFDQFDPGHTEKNRIIVNFETNTGEKAVDYLYQLGHRDIGVISGDLNRYSTFQRHQSFLNGFNKNGLNIRHEWLEFGDITEKDGYECMRHLLRKNHKLPTALCCTNDAVAFGVVRACREAGIRVPADLSIIGIDDHILSADFKPALTTFRFDFADIFQQLTHRLIEVIDHPESEAERIMYFASSFIERDSCRPL